MDKIIYIFIFSFIGLGLFCLVWQGNRKTYIYCALCLWIGLLSGFIWAFTQKKEVVKEIVHECPEINLSTMCNEFMVPWKEKLENDYELIISQQKKELNIWQEGYKAGFSNR